MKNNKFYINQYVSFSVFLFLAIALIAPSGFSIGASLLMLGSIIFFQKNAFTILNTEDLLLIITFLFYFCVAINANFLHNEFIKEYDLPLRFLLIIPILILLRTHPPSPSYFWAGLAIGGILAGCFISWQAFSYPSIIRPGGHTNPIQYGNISFIIGVLCFIGVSWSFKQKYKTLWITFLLFSGCMAMIGSLLTRSRGSWIGLPLCLYLLYIHYKSLIHKYYMLASLMIIAIVIGIIIQIPQTQVKFRTKLAIQEAILYLHTRNADTSIGTRMEMWRNGWRAFMKKPFLGWGKNGFVQWETSEIKAGHISSFMQDKNHVYNEWLDAAVKRGLLGLISLLILYIVPLYLFIQRLRKHRKNAKYFSVQLYTMSGLLLILNYMGFGLSQVFLSHNIGVMMFIFLLSIIWSLVQTEEKGSTSNKNLLL